MRKRISGPTGLCDLGDGSGAPKRQSGQGTARGCDGLDQTHEGRPAGADRGLVRRRSGAARHAATAAH